jgi:glycerophosphoryl diester phosphodiesterase
MQLPTPAYLVPRWRPVEIVCHQGANEYAPPNTFAAAQICVDWGMDYVEIDVNMSKDGVMYLFHGPEIGFTTNGVGNFHEHDACQIDRLDAGGWFDAHFRGEPVPRLDAFLRWIKGKAKVYFDIKRADLPALLALVTEMHWEDDSFFWLGDPEMALAFRRLAPHLMLKVNAETAAGVVAAREQLGANLIEAGVDSLNAELVETCRAGNVKLMVYHTEKDPVAFRKMLDWGVDLINCNHGDVVAQVAAAYWGSQQTADNLAT